MVNVIPGKVAPVQREGCSEISSSSRHGPCLFPQHGPGTNTRPIILEAWQRWVAVERYADASPRAHSLRRLAGNQTGSITDATNTRATCSPTVAGHPGDLHTASARAGISCKQNGEWSIAISQRDSVANMDQFVGSEY